MSTAARSSARAALALIAIAAPIAAPIAAQQPAAAHDSLTLAALQADALRADPRRAQLRLQADITALHLRNIAAEEYPALAGTGQAQYQSAVTKIAVPLPGVSIPTPPHDTYNAYVNAQESLLDPSRAPRRAVERAQLSESQAQVRVALYGLRQDVNDAFFAALTDQEREAATQTAIDDLNARLRETATRFANGAALPADTASIAASILARRQDLLQIHADRAAALARLSDLVGHPIGDRAPLSASDAELGAATNRILDSLLQLRARPEYAQFAATRDRLAEQEAANAAQAKPRVSAFGRVGYGRPGLNMLSTNFQSYWLAGLQVDWAPWTWGTLDRERRELELQRDIVATNEASFTETLRRAIRQPVATIAQLDSAIALDDRIIGLRETVETETRAQLREGVVTAAEYVDRYTDLLSARLTRAQHGVARAQARATLLTTLGVEVP